MCDIRLKGVLHGLRRGEFIVRVPQLWLLHIQQARLINKIIITNVHVPWSRGGDISSRTRRCAVKQFVTSIYIYIICYGISRERYSGNGWIHSNSSALTMAEWWTPDVYFSNTQTGCCIGSDPCLEYTTFEFRSHGSRRRHCTGLAPTFDPCSRHRGTCHRWSPLHARVSK